jgi:hypothetical protein
MKKLICVLLSVLLLFLMVGCAKKGTFNEYTYDGMFITPRPIYAETKEEIEELAKHERAPAGFLKPDDLRVIGEPEQRIAYYSNSGLDFTLYFNDANEVRITVRMRYEENYTPSKSTKKVTDGMTSMRYIETPEPIKGTAYIERCGVVYCYGKDNYLNEIILYVDDVRMSIDAFCTGENPYPENQQETFYAKLLSLSDEVVLDALDELKEAIYARWGGKERIPSIRKWLIPIGIGVGVVALGATGFVVWKKKKRKATNTTESPEPQPVDTPQQA